MVELTYKIDRNKRDISGGCDSQKKKTCTNSLLPQLLEQHIEGPVMCNPNSSIANRRPRPLATLEAAVAKSSSMITKNLLGNMYRNHTVAVQPSTDCTQFNYATSNGFAAALPPYPSFYAPEEKPKKKRKRKPQMPGKTAKQNDRHFVVHDYHDHSQDVDDEDQDQERQRRRGGVSVSFPLKLHSVLDEVERDGLAHVISWQPHGRCFLIHKPKEFVETVMPHYFRQSKLTSFQRQLNLYGFARLTKGQDGGGYYHELFLRGKVYLCKRMVRTKVKGTKFKAASSPEQEPDFYSMVGTRKLLRNGLVFGCLPRC